MCFTLVIIDRNNIGALWAKVWIFSLPQHMYTSICKILLPPPLPPKGTLGLNQGENFEDLAKKYRPPI